MSLGVKLTPNLVTRVEENLKQTLGKSDPVQHSDLVYFRGRLHEGIFHHEQVSEDLHQRLSELYVPARIRQDKKLQGNLEHEQDGEPVVVW